MQRLLYALLVTVFAAAMLTIARADAAPPDTADRAASMRASSSVQAEPSPQPAVRFATVVKPFGASIRVAPSLDAARLSNAACGALLPVSTVRSGWVKVRTPAGDGWIGVGRVTVSDAPISVDCAARRFLDQAADARTFVPGACAALQARPSHDAVALDCVENGHRFTVVDGPFDPGTGEDWFKVTSPPTGTGWLLAEHLYPV
jgi:hypothetical protein